MERPEPDYIILDPDFPAVLRYFAWSLKYHNFEAGAKDPIVSFIEQVRFMYQSDPDELEKILDELRADRL